jgi:citrate lyase subunit gamma (acyl carrier protein)
MKFGIAGSLESNDCLISVKPSKERVILIESIVYEQFGHLIEKVIKETLDELKVDTIYVKCDDKGALDYTIKARLKTAIRRAMI